MLNKLSLSQKINILIATFTVIGIVFFATFINGQKRLEDESVSITTSLIDSTEQVKVKTMVLNMVQVINTDFKNIDVNNPDTVYQILSNRLDHIRFENDKSGYFFVYQNTKCILAPDHKPLEGKERRDAVDAAGVNFVFKMNEAAKKGGGYVGYRFNKPGKGETDKISYVVPIADTDYWLASGIYLDNVENAQINTQKHLSEIASKIATNTVIPISILIIILILFSISLKMSIIKPISRIINITDYVARGKLSNIEIKRRDEISKIATSLNNLINRLRNTSDFATEIGQGNFDSEFKEASEDDMLGKSLLTMRHSLIEARTSEEKRSEEEKIRSWTMNGHTIINDILRENQHKIEVLADTLLQKIIEYVKLNQGGIFLLNQENKSELNLIASYAYDRKKFMEKTIEVGEGLIGTCAMEQKTIFMTDIPDNYINIGSGLGDSKPRCLLIVPLIINDQFYGVIELASFNRLKEHEIAFIEKTAENIASTISIAQITINTANLLEQSKQQSEELSAQEEEMRQNMEELMATQEESQRKEHEISEILNAINKSVKTVTLDSESIILDINDLLTVALGSDNSMFIGKPFSTIVKPEDSSVDNETLWDLMLKGERITRDEHVIANDINIHVKSTYNPIMSRDKKLDKVIILVE
ncbi:MAG: cache domain-containing protein [Bacteroidales bacterium]|jgi:signal transduction histidine kinase|nr:cache domain-containing protein [Bacteroidales bacterium]